MTGFLVVKFCFLTFFGILSFDSDCNPLLLMDSINPTTVHDSFQKRNPIKSEPINKNLLLRIFQRSVSSPSDSNYTYHHSSCEHKSHPRCFFHKCPPTHFKEQNSPIQYTDHPKIRSNRLRCIDLLHCIVYTAPINSEK